MIDLVRRGAARIAAAVAAYAAAIGIDIDPARLEDWLSIVFIALAIPLSNYLETWIGKAVEWVRDRAGGWLG